MSHEISQIDFRRTTGDCVQVDEPDPGPPDQDLFAVKITVDWADCGDLKTLPRQDNFLQESVTGNGGEVGLPQVFMGRAEKLQFLLDQVLIRQSKRAFV